VTLEEFGRFSDTDRSVLAHIYGNVKFDAVPFVTVTVFGRVVLLVPPLVLAPGTLAQIATIAAGEILFFGLLVWRDPFLSDWLKAINIIGSVHQMVIIALQAYTIGVSYEKDVSAQTGTAMVATTAVYLFVVLGLLAFLLCGEFVHERFRKRHLSALLRRIGFTHLQQCPLVIVPGEAGTVQTTTIGPDDLSDLGGSDVDSDFDDDDFGLSESLSSGRSDGSLRRENAGVHAPREPQGPWRRHYNDVVFAVQRRNECALGISFAASQQLTFK